MNDKREILDKAIAWFYESGVKDLTETKIQEYLDFPFPLFPTLFRDKEDLVLQAIEHNLNTLDVFPQQVLALATNPVEEIILMFKCCAGQVEHVHPGFF